MRVVALRAFVLRGAADYHDQSGQHWIDDHIATPLSSDPRFRSSRRSFGLNLLGSVLVEVEASDGTVGFAVTTGGGLAAWIVEQHLALVVVGAPVASVEDIWDRMFRATLFYGRKGLVLNAISGVDLALWDLLGKSRGEPVYAMLGGTPRTELSFYATGPDPVSAARLGFIGCKVPLRHGDGPAPDLAGVVEHLGRARHELGSDFWLMIDCWMSLDFDESRRLLDLASELELKWLEEPLLPDDYWAYAALHAEMSGQTLLATGEHESTALGFKMLVEMDCCDVLQPDVGWCGGLTALNRINQIAAHSGKLVIPHGSSVYSYHFLVSSPTSPFGEFLLMSPRGDQVVPMFGDAFADEPVPRSGKIALAEFDRPGFGVTLAPDWRQRAMQVPADLGGRYGASPSHRAE